MLSSVTIVDISVGAGHTLALSASGEVWAWGRNNYGQLGLDSTSQLHVQPQVVPGLHGKFILQVTNYPSTVGS